VSEERIGRKDRLMLTDAVMERIKLGVNFAVFLLFFGIAALEALQTRNWVKAALWVAIGIVFLTADNLRRVERGASPLIS
jgi:hypothetical protein